MTADDVNPGLVEFLWENKDRTVQLFTTAPDLLALGVPRVMFDGLSVLLTRDTGYGETYEVYFDLTKVVAWSLPA